MTRLRPVREGARKSRLLAVLSLGGIFHPQYQWGHLERKNVQVAVRKRLPFCFLDYLSPRCQNRQNNSNRVTEEDRRTIGEVLPLVGWVNRGSSSDLEIFL